MYKAEKHVDQKTYQAAKMSREKIAQLEGNDFTYGNIEGVNFKFSELIVQTQSSGNKSETDLSFWGLFMAAEFPKHFKAHTIIYSKKGNLISPSSPGKSYYKIPMDSP